MNSFKNILWGIVLVSAGLIWGLNALDIVDINLFFHGWWTLFIIVPCFINIFKDEDKTGSLIGLVIGILLLLSCQGIMEFRIIWKLLIPIILVIMGLSFIFKNTIRNKINRNINKLNKFDKEKNEYYSTFSSKDINFDNEKFIGSCISAVFGGVKLDLRNSIIDNDVIIDCSSIFGGIDIYLPKNVNVKVNSSSIFGGVENKIKNDSNNNITVYINANCLFGGVEIK